ncbi:hypothetical protein [Fimbriimonas ginsengisoli]|uniref:Transmembrane protein n=1 Tax=Fimbriimonas ginsengisoli Gsoil 348 TaxID=661478 RepID=A0A068NLL5_FIMGI|nr:hypothetical protein [Fimbriimonas ginsengisoli]AIE83640.1 hypothetical protein OP10G_0272 [Fimbriimonas ginsengisoli Gsoil 348]
MGRLIYVVNGVVFLISGWDGLTSTPPAAPVVVWTSFACGAISLLAVIRPKGKEVSDRLGSILGAVGMIAAAVGAWHHRSGIQYGYLTAAALYLLLASNLPQELVRRARERRQPEPQ